MKTKLICDDLEFWFDKGNLPYIRCKKQGSSFDQGIIAIEHTSHLEGYHYLYLWYDEEKFPEYFDTKDDGDGLGHRRLQVVGVDEI